MKIGLALAGGGARGAYQIGAWKALREKGFDKQISVYSGASVGSLNAVMFAMGDYELAEKTWLSLDKDSLFNIEKHIYKRLLREKLNFFNKGVYSTKKLEKLLDETVKFELLENKEVYVATTFLGEERKNFYDLLRVNYEHFFTKDHDMIKYKNLAKLSVENMKNSLLASCAIPVAFRPITIDGEKFYDGGILDNVPVQPLLDAKCDKILVIDLFRINFKQFLIGKKPGIMYVHPNKSLRGILDFDKDKIKRRFQLGYEDMKQFLIEHPDFFLEK